MQRALSLARKAGRTSPNPSVGAVLVKNKKILSTGYHRGPGTLHAEADAIENLKKSPLYPPLLKGGRGGFKGLTLYVTLEPCCHTKKRTPPCVNAIFESGIRRVVIGTKDLNPQVNGKGIRFLKSRGIQVECGCLAEECQELVQFYQHGMTQGRPYVILKAAMTLDGKIATAKGKSRWITGEASRKKVHELRAQVDAVLVGAGTVLKDDPELTVREVKGENPVRVVLDSHLKIPLDCKVFSELPPLPGPPPRGGRVKRFNSLHQWERVKTFPPLPRREGVGGRVIYVATLYSHKKNPKVKQLQKKGVEILFCKKNAKGKLDLKDLLHQLGKACITSVMVEGGAEVFSEFISRKQVDEFYFFIAPRLLGGEGLSVFQKLQIQHLKQTPGLEIVEVQPLGEDLWIRAHYVHRNY